ncbi:MAG: rnhB [Francisellaceae bacterium]|nr:rnhB [Francisellaceae bacterium]
MLIAGVDEVGRGPLAGPVVAAAVILDQNRPIKGLADSKKLSLKARELLYEDIFTKALAVGIGEASIQEIDSINILQASLLAMRRAVLALKIKPDHIEVDGINAPSVSMPVTTIIKGDSLIPAISAASIIAKVTRDRLMDELDKVYPEFGFKQHKGYPTAFHLQALENYGISPIHRLSFKPVKKFLPSKIIDII